MCVTCGCGDDAKATVLNLQTGSKSALGGDHTHDHPHEHEHVLPDGTRVRHVHADGHDHTHGREDGHHEHVHGAGHDHDDAHSHGHGHEHVHADGTRHDHHHHHDHDEGHSHAHADHHARTTTLALETRILAKNDERAARNRAWLAGREIFALNLMSAPGAGKTTLLERTIRDLAGRETLFVIEGDQATANDAERIRAAGAQVVQVNTGTGCHLDADMVAFGLKELKPPSGAVVIIENVGNLVCPALFDLGEATKVAILSVTEGDDKPAKYPHMFAAANLLLINKIDLLPYVDFSVDKAIGHARDVNPHIEVLCVSARAGDGLNSWYGWLAARLRAVTSAVAAEF